jgi:hypothetical protein
MRFEARVEARSADRKSVCNAAVAPHTARDRMGGRERHERLGPAITVRPPPGRPKPDQLRKT